MLLTSGPLGSYEVTALIGRGRHGRVYRARDTKLDRDVWGSLVIRYYEPTS